MNAKHHYAVVEETLTKKSNIISPNATAEDDNVYKSDMKILEVGPTAEDLGFSSGQIPLMAKWAEPAYVKVISGAVGDQTIIRHCIFDAMSIVGTD